MSEKITTIQSKVSTKILLKAMAKKEKRTIYGLVELMAEERLEKNYNNIIPVQRASKFEAVLRETISKRASKTT